jgi:NAD(P)-dependent dehydrogenase (short-subunit alcohol dehydrogenase family)
MILEELKLDGDVAIITAIGQSWTKELALSLAQAGADVVIASRQPEIESAAEEVRRLGREAIAMPTDLTSTQEVQRMVQQTASRFGKIDILVNSLNVEFAKPILEVAEEEWHRVINANLTSAFLCCQAVGRYMLEQKAGRIVNITSGLGAAGLPNSTAYCASMGGVIQLTKALALEWARQNIRVNAIGAGWMEKAKAEDTVVRYIPERRLGNPEDLAALATFLASDASSYLSGHLYLVDGGLMARA